MAKAEIGSTCTGAIETTVLVTRQEGYKEELTRLFQRNYMRTEEQMT